MVGGAPEVDPAATRRATVERMSKKPSVYKVVVNHEEQYSIWPVDREVPRGWKETSTTGTQEECEQYITRTRRG